MKDEYTLVKVLGKGCNSIVYQGYNKTQDNLVAIKIPNYENIKSDQQQNALILKNEYQALLELEHPNIIKALNFIEKSSIKVLSIQEYGSQGELFKYCAQGRFSEIVTRTLFHQLISGIAYCHSKSIVHRDIKLDNLVFDKKYCLKIIDFGFAGKMDKEGYTSGFYGT